MRRLILGVVAAALFILAVPACGGDDDDSVEAAEWCRLTAHINRVQDRGTGVITFDLADRWIESAPREIRGSTAQAARILRDLPTDPRPPALLEAREEISAYQADHCV
jgi:hypothetical protein